MFKGATGKRFFYFLSALFRSISFLGLLIAYIIIKIVADAPNKVLTSILLILSITCLLTSLFNLILCGYPATAYNEKKSIQIICFIVTIFTGGILSTILTGFAVFIKVEKEEIENEKIFNTKTYHNKDGKINEKTKK